MNGKFDTIFSSVLVDFNAPFVSRIVALKYVNFRQVGVIIVPGLDNLILRHFLIDQGHVV